MSTCRGVRRVQLVPLYQITHSIVHPQLIMQNLSTLQIELSVKYIVAAKQNEHVRIATWNPGAGVEAKGYHGSGDVIDSRHDMVGYHEGSILTGCSARLSQRREEAGSKTSASLWLACTDNRRAKLKSPALDPHVVSSYLTDKTRNSEESPEYAGERSSSSNKNASHR